MVTGPAHPYYVRDGGYVRSRHGAGWPGHGLGVDLPTSPMDRSERQQIALLAKLDEEGSVSKKALIEFGVERNPLFIRDCDRPFDDHGNPAKQSHARLRRHAIDPLQERGFVDVEQVGRVSARRRRTERA